MFLKNINTRTITKSYTGIPKENIPVNITTNRFRAEEIKLLNSSTKKANVVSEKELESYNKQEKSKNLWKRIGFTSLGIALLFAGIFKCKKGIFNNKNITKNLMRNAKISTNTKGIMPANLKERVPKNYIDYEKTDGKYVKELAFADTRIIDSYNPKTLPIIKFPNKTMHISNFEAPHGSIAISSSLNKTISTDGLLQCAAVSVVDKKMNMQTLLHCCPGQNAQENRVILDYILSHSQSSNPEITIIPGCYKSTDSTISFLVDNIKDILGEKCKINFANITPQHESIILKNGKLSCADKTRHLSESEINPVNKIIFSSSFFKNENGVLKYIK